MDIRRKPKSPDGATTFDHLGALRYRLGRIRELTDLDLNDVDSRFNLHVATRAGKVLGSV
ncbi:helix-turn-helix domain-containing protein [Amycolatopsis mongoliensis]|uniref:Helix-turn-helix domain-containing protein n=1 Tax=Amycolatopsis mongoliensis TaxID=715475 RepID=A0A9Y2JIB6_9PSEU|nr:helix-turn-helix domain-containing protein [Amycolatopsis sp. 4-36]WIX98010.1 helix-turn-helix domain-containing protein [Amycolatopsis sp. 4-36]